MELLNIVKSLAFDPNARDAFMADTEAFLDQCDALSEYEKELLRRGNAGQIEGYLKNPVTITPGTEINAAPTIVNVAAVIIVASPSRDASAATRERFDADWGHVASIAAHRSLN